jgi:hypothetical protein
MRCLFFFWHCKVQEQDYKRDAEHALRQAPEVVELILLRLGLFCRVCVDWNRVQGTHPDDKCEQHEQPRYENKNHGCPVSILFV